MCLCVCGKVKQDWEFFIITLIREREKKIFQMVENKTSRENTRTYERELVLPHARTHTEEDKELKTTPGSEKRQIKANKLLRYLHLFDS